MGLPWYLIRDAVGGVRHFRQFVQGCRKFVDGRSLDMGLFGGGGFAAARVGEAGTEMARGVQKMQAPFVEPLLFDFEAIGEQIGNFGEAFQLSSRIQPVEFAKQFFPLLHPE